MTPVAFIDVSMYIITACWPVFRKLAYYLANSLLGINSWKHRNRNRVPLKNENKHLWSTFIQHFINNCLIKRIFFFLSKQTKIWVSGVSNKGDSHRFVKGTLIWVIRYMRITVWRRHSPWPLVHCHGCWFTHSQFHSRRYSLRITLKYTTLVRMRNGSAWTGIRDNWEEVTNSLR